jgi:deazaflavin-dependent oxidoreductase (nitroreductase family)
MTFTANSWFNCSYGYPLCQGCFNERRIFGRQRKKKVTLKILLRIFMAIQVGIYRLTSGKMGSQMPGFKVLLLNNKGRKSGKTYITPLGYFDNEKGYIIIASNSGQPTHPAWYYNLKSNPQVTVQVLDKVLSVTAEVLTGEARTLAWQQVIASAPLYNNYKKKTTREIPVILLYTQK